MFRFTIRDVLWLTILAAVLVAWWLQWRSQVVARDRDAQTIQQLRIRAEEAEALRRNSAPFFQDLQAPPQRPFHIDDSE